MSEIVPHALHDAIAADAPRYGAALARRAFELGLAVTGREGESRPIPIGALPVIVEDAAIDARRALATDLLAATARAARWQLDGAGREQSLSALSPAERRLVQATAHDPADIAVARIDFLLGPQPYALEVNTTIPAMQGYSDIAARAWLETFAEHEADALHAANGSNAAALLEALTTLYAVRRAPALRAIGLLCRRGDAQSTELDFLRRAFGDAGFEAVLVHPDQLVLRGGTLEVAGQPLQLLYRHLFLHRLDREPSALLERALCDDSRHGTLVLNRPTPHLEMKSTLAWLSRSDGDDALASQIGLEPAQRAAIRTALPWTRMLVPEPAHDAEQTAWQAALRADPDAFVLKRSWSYGGSDVFVGRARGSDEFERRVRATWPEVRDWAGLCDAAQHDRRGGGFVVQRAVSGPRGTQWLCTPDGAQQQQVTTDYSAYASLGASPAWGGVCRAAASDVVNIVAGGAVVPLLRRSVADRVLAARASR